MKFLLTLGGIALWFVAAFLCYWWGRVLLPATGLTAPEYWTWFWALLPVGLAGVLAGVLGEVVSW